MTCIPLKNDFEQWMLQLSFYHRPDCSVNEPSGACNCGLHLIKSKIRQERTDFLAKQLPERMPGDDGPGEEDGPWAEGWEQRSSGAHELNRERLAEINLGASPTLAESIQMASEIKWRRRQPHEPAAQPECRRDHIPEWPALRDVIGERHRQVHTEGWTPEHDDQHDRHEMACAAAAYAMPAHQRRYWGGIPELWLWNRKWWKPKDRRRDLVRAGALILAEIERLDRLSLTKGGSES